MPIFPNFLSEAIGQIKGNVRSVEKTFNKNYEESLKIGSTQDYFGKMSIVYLKEVMYPNIKEEKFIETKNWQGKMERFKVREI